MAIARLHPASSLTRLIDDYLLHCRARGLAPRTIDGSYGYALRSVLSPWCTAHGVETVDQLDGRTMDRFMNTLLVEPGARGQLLSKHSVRSYTRCIRVFLTWADRQGELVSVKPQLPRAGKPHREVLSREEIDSMEAALEHERDKLIIRILGDCGMRLDELSSLTTLDIVRSGRQAHFRVHGKGDRYRPVPVPPTILRRLERHLARQAKHGGEDRLFLSRRRDVLGAYHPLTSSGVYQVVTGAAVRAGITKRVYPHLLRHSWMTEMLRRGMNPLQLSRIAGASIQVIKQHYEHLTDDDAYEALLKALAGR